MTQTQRHDEHRDAATEDDCWWEFWTPLARIWSRSRRRFSSAALSAPKGDPRDDHSAHVTSSSHLDLTRGGGSWQAETPMTALRPGTSYTLYGWTRDNSWSSAGVEFSPEDLANLRPDSIPSVPRCAASS